MPWQVQGNELLIYNNSGSTPPSKAQQPPPELRSKARVFRLQTEDKKKAIPVTDICSVSVPETDTGNGISNSIGVLNCGQVTMATGVDDTAFSLTSFGTVFQINLTTGRTKQLLESICSPGGSSGSRVRGWSHSIGAPNFFPMCSGFTGLAAVHLGGDQTKLFVTLEQFGGLASEKESSGSEGNSGGPQRAVVEFVTDMSSKNLSLLWLNSSIPYELYPRHFALAASFLTSTAVQAGVFLKQARQPGKYLAGNRVRLSAGHGKLFVGLTEGSLSPLLSFDLFI